MVAQRPESNPRQLEKNLLVQTSFHVSILMGQLFYLLAQSLLLHTKLLELSCEFIRALPQLASNRKSSAMAQNGFIL